ncbi:MAG: hypothetical protein ACI8VC_002130 [Candidatus Endobugula sp.]|jgi:hypothetical protein
MNNKDIIKKNIPLVLCIFIAFVFLQSLPFKFTHSLETQHIFTTLADWSGFTWFGVYGGYLVGTAELVAAIILLAPFVLILLHKMGLLGAPELSIEFKSTALTLGAIMAIGIMTGAIFFHLFTPLGIIMPYFDASTGLQIGNDSGVLFIMACLTWASAVALALIELKNPNNCFSTFVTTLINKKS